MKFPLYQTKLVYTATGKHEHPDKLEQGKRCQIMETQQIQELEDLENQKRFGINFYDEQ